MSFIRQSITKHTAWVTLARPEMHNAFNEAMIAELQQAFEALGENPAVRIIVLAGEGKSFCAGADLHWMQSMLTYSYTDNVADAQRLAHMLETIDTCPKPVIGRIQGAVFGGGVGLASVCDMTVALHSAVFCLSEVKLGLLPAVISPYVLSKMAEAHARRYFLTAERFTADEAKQMGLISQVVDTPAALDAQVDAWTTQLRANAPDALGECKQLIRTLRGMTDIMAITALTTDRIAQRRISAEGQEGMRAFLEKRPPNWGVGDVS